MSDTLQPVQLAKWATLRSREVSWAQIGALVSPVEQFSFTDVH